MKVLHINSVCGIGSTGRICTDIARLLEYEGHNCRIGYGRKSVPKEYEEISVCIGTALDVINHALISRVLDNSGFGSVRATKKFIDWIESYNPDIIHIHNLHGYYINIELLFDYLKHKRKPIVWTLHDCWPFTGHCAHFDYIGCQKWKNEGCSTCPQKKQYPTSFVKDNSEANYITKRSLFTGFDNMIIVTPSNWLANLVKQSYLSEYPIEVLYNGIDLSVFKPTKSDFREQYGLQNKIVFLGVASVWTVSKGIYDFIRMNSIKKDNEIFVLVGLNKKQIKELPEGIIGIPRTHSIEKLAEIYSVADVFINPTYAETFGLVNIEAQACGTPVVTYASGGAPEAVPENHVVERGDTIALLEKAREVASMKTVNIINVKEFSKLKCYKKYIELYYSAINI